MPPAPPHTRRTARPLVAAVVGWLISALILVPACALAVLFLAGPHGGLLRAVLSRYILGLGWLTVIVVPLVIARVAWRAAHRRPANHWQWTGRVSRVEERLAAMGLALGPPKAPVANYLGSKLSGELLFVSGRVSALRGEVGSEVDVDQARQAARDTVLDLLAIIKQDIGDLDRIVSVERMQGFVRSAPGFTEQPQVLDGASDLLVSLFGEAGRHARTATGAAQLPFGAAVQLDLVLRLA
jgi:enamine deaminase RidA (YjgF/YER057c/UK114 family)